MKSECVGLKTIYLESNSVDTLEGLLHLSLLRCLYKAKNALMDVEGAVRLKALVTLDISENHVDSLEGLRGHQTLATLVAAGNRLADVDAVDALRACPRLTSLDLSDNKLRDVSVVAFLTSEDAGLANRLALLKFRGNPAVSETKSYRKTVVARMRALNYLDDAPVFPKDRRLAEAWARGGVEEERAERGRIFDDEKKHRERQARNFDAMVAEAKRDAAARASSGEPEPKPNPYRFMSESAAAEARLMLEEDVPEWRIEEMRAQETFPWQVQARREEEARAAAEEEARAAAEEEAEARARAERDAEKARVVEALSASITDETLTQMVAEQVRDSLRLSRASVPVAIPVADDGLTPGIHVAAVAEEDETTSSGTKAQENAFPRIPRIRIRHARRRAGATRGPRRVRRRGRRGGASWSATPRPPVPPARARAGGRPARRAARTFRKAARRLCTARNRSTRSGRARRRSGRRARRRKRRGQGMRVLSGPKTTRRTEATATTTTTTATTRRTEATAPNLTGPSTRTPIRTRGTPSLPSPARDAKRTTSTRSTDER